VIQSAIGAGLQDASISFVQLALFFHAEWLWAPTKSRTCK
jgi:hypothetical protein